MYGNDFLYKHKSNSQKNRSNNERSFAGTSYDDDKFSAKLSDYETSTTNFAESQYVQPLSHSNKNNSTFQNQQLKKKSTELIHKKSEQFLLKSANLFKVKGPAAVDFITLSKLLHPELNFEIINKFKYLDDHAENNTSSTLPMHNATEKEEWRQFLCLSIKKFQLQGPKKVDFLRLAELLTSKNFQGAENNHLEQSHSNSTSPVQLNKLLPQVITFQKQSFLVDSIKQFKTKGPASVDFLKLSELLTPQEVDDVHSKTNTLQNDKELTQPLTELEKEILELDEDPTTDETVPRRADYDNEEKYYLAVMKTFLSAESYVEDKEVEKKSPF